MPREESNYWERLRRGRYSRRSVLRTGGLAGAGAAGFALVGCGNDDDDDENGNGGSPTEPANGETPTNGASPTASNGNGGNGGGSGEPQSGGTWQSIALGEAPSLDAHAPVTFGAGQILAFVYEWLVRPQVGPGIDPALYQPEPNLAETIERSPDGLEYMVTTRQGPRWHAPVDRDFDAEDVEFSYQRYSGQLDLPENPGMGVIGRYLDNVEAVDERTVVFHLSQPRGDFLSGESLFLYMMPRETGDAFDPVNQMVGTGPWMQQDYIPDNRIDLVRNPNWHRGPDMPYMDGVTINFVPEYSTRLNQFLAGNLDEVDLDGIDLQRVQQERPDAQILVRPARLPASYLTFEGEHRAPDAPWRDPRVRRAMSMAIDRDALLDAAYNLSNAEDLGFPTEYRWNNDVPSFDSPYWLDPKGEFQHDSGDPMMTAENQEAFAYSPENAMAQLAEAGYEDGFSTQFITTSGAYGSAFNTQSELIHEYLRQVGIDLAFVDQDYAAEYVSSTAAQGEFEGMAHIPRGSGARGNFESYYIPGGPRNNGHIEDEDLIGMVDDMLAEADPEAARLMMLDIQNYTNERMYYMPLQLGASGDYYGYSSRARNIESHQINGYLVGGVQHPSYWLDES